MLYVRGNVCDTFRMISKLCLLLKMTLVILIMNVNITCTLNAFVLSEVKIIDKSCQIAFILTGICRDCKKVLLDSKYATEKMTEENQEKACSFLKTFISYLSTLNC